MNFKTKQRLMMILNHILKPFPVLPGVVSAALVFAGCTQKELVEPEMKEGTGCLSVEISLPQTKADAGAEYNALDYSTVRIFSIVRDTDNEIISENLVRKYRPASKMPASLYLAAGEYKITVEAGTEEEATFTDRTYYGEEVFILEANRNKSVKVTCGITNVVVKVVFDQTVKTAFDKGYKVYVSASDTFSEDDAEAGRVPTLGFTEDRTGYFILPDGVSDLSWGFFGSSSDEAIDAKGTASGVIDSPQPGMQYTLTYKYSKDADGYLLTTSVQVADYDELCEDQFVFSPQPVITADGFSFDETLLLHDKPIKVNISAINPLSGITVTVGDQTFTAMDGGAVSETDAVQGMELTVTDEYNATLALLPEFSSNIAGGLHQFVFEVKDSGNAEVSSQVDVISSGASDLVCGDLWFGNATLEAVVTDPDASDVKIRYRESSEEDWTETAMTKAAEDYTYTADVTGFTVGRTYEIQLTVGESPVGKPVRMSTEKGVQMPNAGFEEWGTFDVVCPYSSEDKAFWGTGNKGASMASVTLTDKSADIRPGSEGTYSARLESKDAKVFGIGKFAAGNIFVGKFGTTDISSMSGTVEMGRAFEFNARPQSLRGWYKYTPGGSTDKGRIFVCLVRMDGDRTSHTVNTNEAYIDATSFDPKDEFLYTDKNDSETKEGHIIGYGELMFETSVKDWDEFEIPITYREKYADEKPNVLMVTATASWRGDYFDGEVGSLMYLDDLEFVY